MVREDRDDFIKKFSFLKIQAKMRTQVSFIEIQRSVH